MKSNHLKPEDIKKFIEEKGLKLSVSEDREYQLRIICKTLNYILIDGIDSVMIESPTGSGKTAMGQVIVQYLYDIGYTKSHSWVAMRKELLNQAKKHTEKIEAKYNMHYVSMFNKEPPITDIVVIDECQHDATESATSQHTYVKPKLTIGLSATPYRQDSAKLFFKKTIRDANTRVLIKAGVLARFNHYMIDEWTPISVAIAYLGEVEKWGQSIVFFRTYEECEEFASILEQAEVPCEVVTQSSNRDKQLESFERGETRVLVNMMILTEGFDCNTIDSAFIRDSSNGPTRQMAGRALRLNGNVVKNIIQSKRTKYTFLKVADANAKYILKEDVWEKIEENKRVEEMHSASVDAIVNTMAEKDIRSESLKASYIKIGWGIKKGRKKKKEWKAEQED